MSTPARNTRRAFSLINVLITVAVMAIVAAAVLPSVASGNQVNVTGAAYLIASDLEYAQSLSLATPDDPALVRFDTEAAAYWIARADDPDTPILRANGRDPYRVEFGEGDAAPAGEVAITVAGAVDGAIAFDGFGRLATLNDALVTLTGQHGVRRVRIDADTGVVTIE
jgi:type II secretory pathway pseudopilin PulG